MIKKNSVVSLAYVLTGQDGKELDRGTKDDPFVYIHGGGQIIRGLESALEGEKVGTKKTVVVQPKDGYGEMKSGLRLTLKKEMFPKDFPMDPGVQFEADLGEGKSGMFTIIEVKGADVHVDGNHPLAGQVLTFNVEILDVRDATQEELSHGHVHGPGGHHH